MTLMSLCELIFGLKMNEKINKEDEKSPGVDPGEECRKDVPP